MKGIKALIWILIGLYLFKSLIISLLNVPSLEAVDACPEFSRDAVFEVHHQRDWSDAKTREDYCLSYKMNSNLLSQASDRKNNLTNPRIESYEKFWGTIYAQLVEEDQQQIQMMIDSLDKIIQTHTLDYSSFAHVVVKMVQDIPYQYILSEKCTSAYSDHPCFGNQRYGITSPVEFLYTLKGDCDSRTVLIYTLLRQFNYDPVILISKQYRHSMLALDIPAAGEYLKIDGKKYYFWETTGTGWEPGIIPPGMNNKKYWNIALKHEL